MLTKRELVRKGQKCEGNTVKQTGNVAGGREEGRKQWRGPAKAFIKAKTAMRGHGKGMGGPKIAQKACACSEIDPENLRIREIPKFRRKSGAVPEMLRNSNSESLCKCLCQN
jgi:hypothetical protein